MARADRPVSPHIGIYRWQISNTLSIMHRLTGVFLSLGAILLVAWLVSVASGFQSYAAMNAFLMGPVGALLLFAWTFALFFHLCNGVRHLFWDTGRGYEPDRARVTGWAVVGAALLLTLGLWIVALAANGG